MRQILFIFLFVFFFISFTVSVFAAGTKATVSYEPIAGNFSKGSENVVTLILRPASGKISAVTLHLQATGGVNIVNVLSSQNADNSSLSNTKVIPSDMSGKSAKVTILVMKATADLPDAIKIPVVVKADKATSGNLFLNVKESQVIDENGALYILTEPKRSYITFSQKGTDSIPPPLPTPLPQNTTVVQMAAKFQGVDPKDVKIKTIPGVKVQLVSGSGVSAVSSAPQFVPFIMDSAGLWHGSAVFPGVKSGKGYAILIKGPKQLQKRFCQNTPTEVSLGKYRCSTGEIELTTQTNLDLTGVALMAGDVGIQDGIENAYDLSFMQNVIRKTSKSSVADADLNMDGKVDKSDYDMLLYTMKNTSGLDQR